MRRKFLQAEIKDLIRKIKRHVSEGLNYYSIFGTDAGMRWKFNANSYKKI
jgi:hypothetical protein